MIRITLAGTALAVLAALYHFGTNPDAAPEILDQFAQVSDHWSEDEPEASPPAEEKMIRVGHGRHSEACSLDVPASVLPILEEMGIRAWAERCEREIELLSAD